MLIEWLRRRPFDRNSELNFQRFGLVALLALAAVISFLDIQRIATGPVPRSALALMVTSAASRSRSTSAAWSSAARRPIAVQTMTKTDTRDVKATLRQIHELKEAGCEIVRPAVPDHEAAEALKEIVKGSPLPVIADIHYDHTLALMAIEAGVACLRLNPGNIPDRDKVIEGGQRRQGAADPVPHRRQRRLAARRGAQEHARGSTHIDRDDRERPRTAWSRWRSATARSSRTWTTVRASSRSR